MKSKNNQTRQADFKLKDDNNQEYRCKFNNYEVITQDNGKIKHEFTVHIGKDEPIHI